MLSVKLFSMRNIGARLKHFREQLGLSQLELSQRSSISQASIARIEGNQQKNLKSGTIEKLTTALEIPISQLLQDASVVSEKEMSYQISKMVPVIKPAEYIKAKGNITIIKSSSFEPTLSTDPQAFFLLTAVTVAGISTTPPGDLLLIEPMSKIQNGDIALVLSNNIIDIGRFYHRANVCIFQPLKDNSEPIIMECKKNLRRDVHMFRICEIRKKFTKYYPPFPGSDCAA